MVLCQYCMQLHCCDCNHIHSVLTQNCTLLTIDLGTNGLTDAGARLVGDMLKRNTTLEGFSLWQNAISAQGAQYLADGLQVHLLDQPCKIHLCFK